MLKLKKISMLLALGALAACAGGQKDMADNEEYRVVQTQEEAEKLNEEVVESVEVSDRVFFDFDKYNLKSDAKEVLDMQVEWLKQESDTKVVIEGHCDERGTREYNIGLGWRRANSVRDYLVMKGISSKRIKTISYGKDRPEFLGSGEKVWSKNRRAVTVEVVK